MIEESQRETIEEWMRRSTHLAIKKLARNDCQWADSRDSHQNGAFIPRGLMEANYFPPTVQRTDKPHIWDVYFDTLWIASGERKRSRLARYTLKGGEAQFTGLPKEDFAGLSPASWLLGGILQEAQAGARHWFVTIDSESDDAEWLETLYNLDAQFEARVFYIADPAAQAATAAHALQRELEQALDAGTLNAFIAQASVMPDPLTLAQQAQQVWLDNHNETTLNPYQFRQPGDAIMQISRDIEYDIFRRYEMRHRAAQVIQALDTRGTGGLAGAVIRAFADLNAIFLSASQVRKSRAGRSFEHHIARMLTDGNIIHAAQAVRGSLRPDFVLPSLESVMAATSTTDEALVLSAKTTLRERWKQVSLEQDRCAFFLATVDDRVSSDAIESMAQQDIVLVVPEALKTSKDTVYRNKSSVITFHDFFQHEIRAIRPSLIRSTTI